MIANRLHTTGRIARTLAVPILVLVGLLATAQPALGHHASIKAAAACSDGRYVVEWTAMSWVATDGTTDTGGKASAWRGLNQHPGIAISYRIGSSGPYTSVPGVHTLTAGATTTVIVNGKPRDFPSASSSFELPGDTTGRLTVKVKVGPWGPDPKNGQYTTSGPSTAYSRSIQLAGDCDPTDPDPDPAEPAASAAAVCVANEPLTRVTLTNGAAPGGAAFAFSVTSPAAGSKPAFDQSVTVDAGSTATVDVPVDENASRSVTVAGVGFSQTFTRTGNCLSSSDPTASGASVCVQDVPFIRVTVTNGNIAPGESVDFSVSSPAGGGLPAVAETVTVAAGSSDVVDVPVAENATRTVTVTATGMADVTITETGNCLEAADPSASGESDCVDSAAFIRVTLTNGNTAPGESVTFSLTSPASGSSPALDQDVAVDADSSTTVDVPVDENSTRTVTVNAPGMTEVSITETGNCADGPNPKVLSIGQDCILEVIRVRIQNDNEPGGESVDFTITSAASGSRPAFAATIPVEGGAIRNVDIPADEDTTRMVVISAPGMVTETLSQTLDCVTTPAP